MFNNTNPKVNRLPEVLNVIPISKNNFRRKVSEGTFVPPISLGPRAVGWLEHEVNEMIAAMALGFDEQELKSLVKELVEKSILRGYSLLDEKIQKKTKLYKKQRHLKMK